MCHKTSLLHSLISSFHTHEVISYVIQIKIQTKSYAFPWQAVYYNDESVIQ